MMGQMGCRVPEERTNKVPTSKWNLYKKPWGFIKWFEKRFNGGFGLMWKLYGYFVLKRLSLVINETLSVAPLHIGYKPGTGFASSQSTANAKKRSPYWVYFTRALHATQAHCIHRRMAIRSTIRTELPPNFSLLFCHSDGIIKQCDGDCHTK